MASIYKKDGSPYWWVCYCVDGKKRDKSLKVRNKEVAIRLRNKIEEQIVLGEAGLFVQDEKSIDEFTPIFTDYISKRNSKGTLDRYARSAKLFTCYLKKKHPDVRMISNIRGQHIEQYITYRRESICIKTANNELRAIKRFLNVAKQLNYTKNNPAIGIKEVDEAQKPPSYYTEDDIKLMLENVGGKLKAMIMFLLQTGMRKGEINNLEWSDVDFENKSVSINIKEGWSPKDKTYRRLPLYEESHKALAELKPEGNGYIFGKPDRHLDRTFKKFFDKIGIKGNIKQFRDTYASYSLACGMPLQNLKDNLGHSDIRTTQIYLQVVPRIKSEEVKTLFNGWK